MQPSDVGKDGASGGWESQASPAVLTGPLLLDTHVLLDLWWFHDPRVQALALRLTQVDWVSTAAMTDEWQHVLARGLKVGGPASIPPVTPRPVASPDNRAPWRSRDPDDQKFLDLAYALKPATLWSRDRALLAHRKRAAAAGVRIETPEQGCARLGWA